MREMFYNKPRMFDSSLVMFYRRLDFLYFSGKFIQMAAYPPKWNMGGRLLA
jgi:hypothetical protein